MGYELDKLMQQFGVSTPTLSYSGVPLPVKPTDLSATASATDRANYDALLAKYNADTPLYTSDQTKYKTYSDDYKNRLATTSLYDAPQFQKSVKSSPGTGMFTDNYSQMFQDVLGRLPDSSELAYWKNKFGDMISPSEYSDFMQSSRDGTVRPGKPNPSYLTPLKQPIYNTATESPILQTEPATTQNVATSPNEVGRGGNSGYDGGGSGRGGSGGGGGGLGVGPGQGVSSSLQSTGLGLMALADKYPAWAPLGLVAQGLGFIGGKIADSQIDKMAEAQKALEAIDKQNAAALEGSSSRTFDPYDGTKGVMSVTDTNGNVRSFDPYAGDSAKDAGKAAALAESRLSVAELNKISDDKFIKNINELSNLAASNRATNAAIGLLGVDPQTGLAPGELGGRTAPIGEVPSLPLDNLGDRPESNPIASLPTLGYTGTGLSLLSDFLTGSPTSLTTAPVETREATPNPYARDAENAAAQVAAAKEAQAFQAAQQAYAEQQAQAQQQAAQAQADREAANRDRQAEAQAQAQRAADSRDARAEAAAREAQSQANREASFSSNDGGGSGTGSGDGNSGGEAGGGYGAQAKGGYIGSYAHGGAVRHYQVGGDVDNFEPSQDFKDAEKLTAVLASRKLSPYEREDVESKLEEIYEKIKRRRAQGEPELLTEPEPIPESLLALQIAPAQTRSAMPEAAYIPAMAPSRDLIEPMPESVPVTLRQISQAIADASPLTALKETLDTRPINAEGAPLVRPLDPRLYGESDEVATGKGYSPLDPRLYGETDEVATGPGYSPMDPRLYGETNEVATGPGYSMPAAKPKLLDLAAKYAKPGFTPTFASGSIDPGVNRMALISQNAIANKIANPVVNIRPEYVDDSADRLSIAMPQDTAIPMSPNMAMLQKMLLANQSQASPYAAELRLARAEATAQTAAFNKMLENAIKGQDDNKPSKAEMYFRLAAAFGAPTKTGHFAESLAEVNKSMADQAKETRLAGKAGQALKLQLGLEGAKASMAAAREDVTSLRGLTSEEMKEKAAYGRDLIKEYFRSGEAQSSAGKQAQDEGLIPGTPAYQTRVKAIGEDQFNKLNASVQASLAASQASLAASNRADAEAKLKKDKFDEAKKKNAQLTNTEMKMKEETSQALVTMRDAYADLVKALELSANAYDGSAVDRAQYKIFSEAGNKDPKVVNTGVLDNLLKGGALATAATTLKTQISDSDMKMLNQLQGIDAKSREERDIILKAAKVRLENMYQEKKTKLADILAGKYRETAAPAIVEEAE